MSAWARIRKRSALLRKGWDFARQVPRAAVRAVAGSDGYRARPPAIGNSFPKSGTHQLLQVLEAFPGARHWGSFLASTPSLTLRERSRGAHLRRIRALVPGEYLGAHIFFDQAYADAMVEMNAAHFFIYRDLRDVALSEALYLSSVNRWHRMHGTFAREMTTLEARLSLAINGLPAGGPIDYPDIGTRMRRYRPWIGRPDVFALKYEALNGEGRAALVERMVDFYAGHATGEIDRGEVARAALNNLVPEKSHTFREGGSGKWKGAFTVDHLKQFEAVAGDLNRELGYDA